MSREYLGVVRQRPQFLANSPQEELVIAIREVGATDATGKQHVATDQHRQTFQLEADTVG